MLADQLAAAIADARTTAHIDSLARLVYRALAEGHVTDAAAEALDTALQAQRTRFRFPRPRQPAAPARTPPRSPDRQRSLERRRRIAASGALPPALACRFTVGELAALSVVAREIQRRGRCELPVDAIAAIAGVCRRTVQNATKAAAALGLVVLVERRRRGAPSLSNVISIADAGWRTWLRLAGGQGAKRCAPRNTKNLTRVFDGDEAAGKRVAGLRSQSVHVKLSQSRDEADAHGHPIRAGRG